MKWTELEIDTAISYLQQGLTYGEISLIIDRTPKAIKVKLSKYDKGFLKNKNKNLKTKECILCNSTIVGYGIKFCSLSCSVTYNNRKRQSNRIKNNCLHCNVLTYNRKFCSYICNIKHKKQSIIKAIENNDRKISAYSYKKYLIEKYGEKCMLCNWSEINLTSCKIPIELDHINGNYKDNTLKNLRLLCPNCHSLTPTYKALNIGKGRKSISKLKIL